MLRKRKHSPDPVITYNWLEKRVGVVVQGPSKPDRSRWQRPTVCAPMRATVSWTVKPRRPTNTSKTWSLPRAPSGSRPTGGQSASECLSRRPPFQSMWGPPIYSMATQPAKLYSSKKRRNVREHVTFMSIAVGSRLTSTGQRTKSRGAWPWQAPGLHGQLQDRHWHCLQLRVWISW